MQVSLQQPPAQLATGYAQLECLDEALRDAEQELKEAHLAYATRGGPRPEHLYRRVVELREKSRRLLDDLAELFLHEDGQDGEG
jgi:hypothetical protein